MTSIHDSRPGVLFELPPGTRVALTGRKPDFRRGVFVALVEEARHREVLALARHGAGSERLELTNGVRLDVMPWRLDCWRGASYDLIIAPGGLDGDHEEHARIVTATSRLRRAS